MKINLLPFVVESMGDNERIYKDIDEVYKRNKYVFHKVAKNHKLYNHQIIKEGSLIQEEYRKKILGILIGGQGNEDIIEDMLKLIKKGYRYTYIYVENHSEIYLKDYTHAFLKKHRQKFKPEERLSKVLEQNIPILIFLSLNNPNKIIEDDFYNGYMQLLNTRWSHYNDTERTRISLNKVNTEDKEKIKELKKNLYKDYGRIKNFSDLIEKEKKLSSIKWISFLFDYENLSSISILENLLFLEKDIDEILYLYILRDKDLDNTEALLDFLIPHMYIKYMIKAYKNVKEMYFENNKETMFVELETFELELNNVNKELLVKGKSIEEATKRIEVLERENNRFKSELEKEREQRNELNGLREFIFSLDKKIEYKKDEEINYELLKKYKAVMVGGHKKWQQKMKESLPNFIFIHSDMLNFDTNIFNNIDIVFIFVNYLSHGMYYKIIETLKGKDTKIVYINRQNEKDVLRIIQEEILEKH